MTSNFSGEVKAEWMPDGRLMKILNPVTFVDSKNVYWFVAPGEFVDGASIPRFLWNFIGSPFAGKYRRASVVHDVYCKDRRRPSKQVHRMFYEAMIVDGVESWKARLMYWGVRTFGPRW